MPGLRHAHTLQQLKEIVEYSPPGEYLNNLQENTTTKKNNEKEQQKHLTTELENISL